MSPVARTFPFPLPLGWAQVAYSDELAAGAVQALRCFGRELVLFRTESGAPVALDAHCPHLGAHLEYGRAALGAGARWTAPALDVRFSFTLDASQSGGDTRRPELTQLGDCAAVLTRALRDRG